MSASGPLDIIAEPFSPDRESTNQHCRVNNLKSDTNVYSSSAPPGLAVCDPAFSVGESATRKHRKSSRSRTKDGRRQVSEVGGEREPRKNSKKLKSKSKSSRSTPTETEGKCRRSKGEGEEKKKKTKKKSNESSKSKKKSGKTSSSLGKAVDSGKGKDLPEESRTCGEGREYSDEEYDGDVYTYPEEYDYEEDDDDDFVGDFEFIDEEDEKGFTCLEEKDIVQEQKREMEAVAELMSITSAQAGCLLQHYRWKRDKLLAVYLEDPEKVLEIAGIRSGDEEKPKMEMGGMMGGDENSCSICGEDCEADDCFQMGCQHNFCMECWEGYLTNKITTGEAATLTCPGYECNNPMDDASVQKLVSQEVYTKYVMFLTKSFVDSNERVRWCPAPGCGNAVNIDAIRHQTVTCSCGHKFCFKCGEEAHGPALCEQVKEWNKKAMDESETNNWITANTQNCPKCDSAIEKNGGCNHMTCKHCGHDYCWMCRKDWKGHNDFYNCARFEKKTKKSAKSVKGKKSKLDKDLQLALEKQEHRMRLERYLHYYNQFMQHEKLALSNAKLREEIQRKVFEWKENDGTMAEIRFIEKALSVLQESRRALKWAYVRLYFYDDKNIRKNLFEFVKDDLDTSASQLHDYLHAAPFRKVEIVDVTRLCETRLSNLLTSSQDLDG